MKYLIVLIVLVCIIYLLFFTKTGKRVRLRAVGTADEMISKDAATPEGVKAHYNNAIDKMSQDYSEAHDTYAKMLGKIEDYENQLRKLKKKDMQLDLNINSCIEKNDDDGAKTYLSKKQDVSEKIEIVKDGLKDMKEKAALQKEAVDNLFDELNKLKAEKETAILTLEIAETSKALKTTGVSSSEEDKMLEKVRDGVKKTKEAADGNRIAYESSSEVQQKRLDKRMKDEEIQKKLDELKAARKK